MLSLPDRSSASPKSLCKHSSRYSQTRAEFLCSRRVNAFSWHEDTAFAYHGGWRCLDTVFWHCLKQQVRRKRTPTRRRLHMHRSTSSRVNIGPDLPKFARFVVQPKIRDFPSFGPDSTRVQGVKPPFVVSMFRLEKY